MEPTLRLEATAASRATVPHSTAHNEHAHCGGCSKRPSACTEVEVVQSRDARPTDPVQARLSAESARNEKGQATDKIGKQPEQLVI